MVSLIKSCLHQVLPRLVGAYYTTVLVNGILAPGGRGLRRGVSPSSLRQVRLCRDSRWNRSSGQARPSTIGGRGYYEAPPQSVVQSAWWEGARGRGSHPHPALSHRGGLVPKVGIRSHFWNNLRITFDKHVPSMNSGQALSLPKWLRANGQGRSW